MKLYIKLNYLSMIMGWSLVTSCAMAEVISVQPLKFRPTVDGEGSEWTNVPAVTIVLRNTLKESTIEVSKVQIKAGTYGDEVFFYAQWADKTQDLVHKPFVWNEEKQKYVEGPQREDRFAMEFCMQGTYTTDWFSGHTFRSDMWHWKSARSNPIGKASDQMTIISRERILEAYKGSAADHQPLYIFRPHDAGDELYITKRYGKKEQALMPKYIIGSPSQGSSIDISAKGKWENDQWHLELSRKLDTGHPDDVKFQTGTSVLGGIAIFDHSDNNNHTISETLTFQF